MMARKKKEETKIKESGAKTVTELEEELSALRKEKAELEEKLKRAWADYDNLQKQTAREKEEFQQRANQLLLEEIIMINEAFSLVRGQLETLLQRHGVEEVEVKVGEAFDPYTMEATFADGEGEIVKEVLTKGYKLHGKIIKPARVKVGPAEKKKK